MFISLNLFATIAEQPTSNHKILMKFTIMFPFLLATKTLIYAQNFFDPLMPIAYKVSSNNKDDNPIYLLGTMHLGLKPAESLIIEEKITHFIHLASPKEIFFEIELDEMKKAYAWENIDIYQSGVEYYVYNTGRALGSSFNYLEEADYQRKMIQAPSMMIFGEIIATNSYQEFFKSYPALTFYLWNMRNPVISFTYLGYELLKKNRGDNWHIFGKYSLINYFLNFEMQMIMQKYQKIKQQVDQYARNLMTTYETYLKIPKMSWSDALSYDILIANTVRNKAWIKLMKKVIAREAEIRPAKSSSFLSQTEFLFRKLASYFQVNQQAQSTMTAAIDANILIREELKKKQPLIFASSTSHSQQDECAVFDYRNINSQQQQCLQTSSTLFVFGAAHLQGITDHFKKEGYKVEGFHL
jgi:hypothetical protein